MLTSATKHRAPSGAPVIKVRLLYTFSPSGTNYPILAFKVN